MTRYSLAVRTSNVTTANATVEILASALRACIVREIGISIIAATASIFGLGRPAAKGITPTTPVALLQDGGGAASETATVALAWGTGPTIPAAFMRRSGMPATIGAEKLWTFANGLVIPAGASLIIWNLTTVSLAVINITVDE